ncbi:MAG TPA: Uma2 family endonuclease [Phototrophicaceae bacterium]|nr:Uma2 family endonuclease [Phototrophicaceae bacterium]
MVVQTRIGMPMDEFIREFNEAPFELVNGEKIPLMPPVEEHGLIISLLFELLVLYKQGNPNFGIFTETPFVLEYIADWVKGSRVPDLMIFDKARLEEYRARTPDHKLKPLILVPDLCVEVISANDSYFDVDEKVEGYLKDGVRLIWVINPRLKRITALTSTNTVRLTEADTLDGGDVLPGFSLSVRTLFA